VQVASSLPGRVLTDPGDQVGALDCRVEPGADGGAFFFGFVGEVRFEDELKVRCDRHVLEDAAKVALTRCLLSVSRRISYGTASTSGHARREAPGEVCLPGSCCRGPAADAARPRSHPSPRRGRRAHERPPSASSKMPTARSPGGGFPWGEWLEVAVPYSPSWDDGY